MNYLVSYILFSSKDGTDLVKKDPMKNPGWTLISSDMGSCDFEITTDSDYRYLGINFANENRDNLSLEQSNNIKYQIARLLLTEKSVSSEPEEFIPDNKVEEQLADGEYPVSFSGNDFVEKDRNIYLNFKYYSYHTYDADEILNLAVGDRLFYSGEDITVDNISVETLDWGEENMYKVFINDTIVLMTYSFNPQYMIELQADNQEYPKYYETDSISLKISPDICFYDESHNADPSKLPEKVEYNNIMEYCHNKYEGAFPEAVKVFVENNKIVMIEHRWIP